MTLLSLDCLTLTDCACEEVIDSAAEAGFDLVSLLLNPLAAFPRQVVSPDRVAACASLLRQRNIAVHQIKAFDLASCEAIDGARACFAAGARLGARSVLFYHGAIPDHDANARVLRHACDVAAEYGLGVNVEPVSFALTRTVGQACQLIERADRDAGIVFDVLHHVRAGGTAADVAALPPGLIRYVQVNDGPMHLSEEDRVNEATNERAYPGEGAFALPELLRCLPRDVPLGIEAPSVTRRQRGQSSRRQGEDAKHALVAAMSRAFGDVSSIEQPHDTVRPKA